MSNEELKKKYYELVELRIDSDEMWQWIEKNCLQEEINNAVFNPSVEDCS